MRIAVVDSYYSRGSPSGENHAVDAECVALGKAGHTVRLFSAERTSWRGSSQHTPFGLPFEREPGSVSILLMIPLIFAQTLSIALQIVGLKQ